MKKNVQVNQDEIITSLLGDNAALKAHIKTLYSITIAMFSKVYDIDEEKSKKVFDKILLDHASVEETRLILNLGGLDDEIQYLLEDY